MCLPFRFLPKQMARNLRYTSVHDKSPARWGCHCSACGRGMRHRASNRTEGKRMVNWSQESILVTGGTGSFGKKFTEVMLRDYRPHRLMIFSRDELKQHEMRESGFTHPSLRYF